MRIALLILTTLIAACNSDELSTPGGQQASTKEGLQLLHKMQTALGGAKRIDAIRDYDETIRAGSWDSAGNALGEVRKRTRWTRDPSLLRLDQIGPRGTYVLYYDAGTGKGWEILPDLTSQDRYKTTGKIIDLAGRELKFAKAYLSVFEIHLWLADRMPGYRVTSPRPNVVRVEHDGNATDLTLDPASGLPLKSAHVSLAHPDRPVPAELRFEEWKEFAGVRFPTRRVNYLSGVKRGEAVTEDLEVNIGFRPIELTFQPADFAPDIGPQQ